MRPGTWVEVITEEPGQPDRRNVRQVLSVTKRYIRLKGTSTRFSRRTGRELSLPGGTKWTTIRIVPLNQSEWHAF